MRFAADERPIDAPVIAAVDGSDPSLAAARTAARLAHAIAAPLVFVYVRTGPPDWLGRPHHQARLDAEMARARRALDASLEVARREDVAAETEVLEGEPAQRISEFADARNARLVVMGPRRRRLRKSVSRSVIRGSSRPVVVTSA